MDAATQGRHILLSAVLFQEADGWVGVCLQHLIAAQGATLERARHALMCAITGQLVLDLKASRPPLANLQPAPDRYWQMFDAAEERETHQIERQQPAIPPAYILEAISGHDAGG